MLRICRSLDGLPLAIELAAAPAAGAVRRRGGRPPRRPVPAAVYRATAPRRRDTAPSAPWSSGVGICSTTPNGKWPDELTVFAGGATLEASQGLRPAHRRVRRRAHRSGRQVLRGDGRRPVSGRSKRYRAFCAERLAEAGEADQLRRARTAYFLEFAWTASNHLRRAEQLHWLRRLDAERDNLHAALRRATAAGDVSDAAGMVAALSSRTGGCVACAGKGRGSPPTFSNCWAPRRRPGSARSSPLRLQRLARRVRPPAVPRNAAVGDPQPRPARPTAVPAGPVRDLDRAAVRRRRGCRRAGGGAAAAASARMCGSTRWARWAAARP